MTFEQLEAYLSEEKAKDAELRGMDMCGRYARCRYCRRYLDYPCARAHNDLVDVRDSRLPDRIPDWLLPEPPVMRVFGAEKAEEEKPLPAAFPEREASARETPLKAQENAPSAPAEKPPIAREESPREAPRRGEEGRRYVISTLRRGAKSTREAEKPQQEEAEASAAQLAEKDVPQSVTENRAQSGSESATAGEEERTGRGVVSLSPYDGGKEIRYGIAKLKRKKSE